MKKSCATLFAMTLVAVGQAQFSINPASPLLVCFAASDQNNVSSLGDGAGGYFVFWQDKRFNGSDVQVYGQHLDPGGFPLWTANGKALTEPTYNVVGYRIVAWQSGFLLTWVQSHSGNYADSVRCRYLDLNGNDVWSQPVLVAKSGNGIISMDIPGLNIFPNDSGATIAHSYTATGGSTGFTFNRVDFSGNLHWPNMSQTFPLIGYDYRSASDLQNGFYALSKGNGLGSTMYVQHFNLQGITQWTSPTDLTAGGGSEGFYGPITMLPDGSGNLYVVWDVQTNVAATKIDSQGNLPWPGQRIHLSDSATYGASRSSALLDGNKLYITWFETRTPSVTSSVVQRVNGSGAKQWTPAGVITGTSNGYWGYPKVALCDSNSIMNIFQGLNNIDLSAQRIRSNGTVSWTPNSKILASVPNNWAVYADFTVLDDTSGCNAVFWSNYNGDIGGAKLCSDGNLVSLPGDGFEIKTLSLTPNPSPGQIWVHHPSGTFQLAVYDISGSEVMARKVDPASLETKLDLSGMDEGMYLVRVQGAHATQVVKLLVAGR